MNFIQKVKTGLGHPEEVIEWFLRNPKTGWLISDKKAISIMYKLRFHRKMDWKQPKTFNEKLLWLTVYDRNPLYTTLVDKYEAKRWISQKLAIGGGYSQECIIPTYGVYNSFDEIDFTSIPNEFVIKATHDSGTVVVCQNKNEINMERLRDKINKGLSYNYFWYTREWPYKNVKPRIIIEKKLESKKGVPEDYKIFCFNGKAKFWFYASDRDTHVKFDYFDMEWNKLPFEQGHPNSEYKIIKPKCWDEMVSVAEYLSEGFPHLRVDFFIDKYGQFYVGELTLTHFSGLVPFVPDKWDYYFGEMLVLPENN